MKSVNTLISGGQKNADFALFHFRKLKYLALGKTKGTA